MRKGFKYRMGIEEQPIVLIEELHDGLRTAFWNLFHLRFIEKYHALRGDAGAYRERERYDAYFRSLYMTFDLEVDKYNETEFFELIKSEFLSADYFEIFQLLEDIIKLCKTYQPPKAQEFLDGIQNAFEKWNSPYRFHKGEIIPISNQEEIEELRNVELNAIELHLESVEKHLLQAIKHLKPNGDLRNSIKESFLMVESVARLIAPKTNSLGDALNKLDKAKKINPVLKAGFEKMYGYSNGPDGIRHALMEKEDLSMEDARYFLISCSAFTNYLFEKGRKLNLFELKTKD